MSLIGFAVGADKFVPDCSDIMDMLLKTQSESNEPLPDDDPQTSYLISAWARICKILGKITVLFLIIFFLSKNGINIFSMFRIILTVQMEETSFHRGKSLKKKVTFLNFGPKIGTKVIDQKCFLSFQ